MGPWNSQGSLSHALLLQWLDGAKPGMVGSGKSWTRLSKAGASADSAVDLGSGLRLLGQPSREGAKALLLHRSTFMLGGGVAMNQQLELAVGYAPSPNLQPHGFPYSIKPPAAG